VSNPDLAAARREAELVLDKMARWADDWSIIEERTARALRALLAATAPAPEAPASDSLARFGAAMLTKWWDDGNPGDIDGGDAQDAAEQCGLWHQVERHADGVECEWCGNEGPCGELTEAGQSALATQGGGR
jgi:hypothetical protein